MSRRLLLACLVVRALTGLPVGAAEHDWLVGRWELTHDPQGDPKDWLEFHADGRAVSIAPSGRRTPGECVVVEGEVRIVYTLAGRQIPITLTVSSDRAWLFARSARTGTAATYERVK
jgi:hypothetical protein